MSARTELRAYQGRYSKSFRVVKTFLAIILMPATSPVPARLEQLISALGMKKKEFAESVGVTPTYVSQLLAGQRPSATLILAICCIHKVNREWLERGQGEMLAGGRQSSRALNLELLELALEAVEEGLGQAERQLPPEKKAKVVAAVYDLYQEEEWPLDKAKILRLIASAA